LLVADELMMRMTEPLLQIGRETIPKCAAAADDVSGNRPGMDSSAMTAGIGVIDDPNRTTHMLAKDHDAVSVASNGGATRSRFGARESQPVRRKP
jgi:hypothetical protein